MNMPWATVSVFTSVGCFCRGLPVCVSVLYRERDRALHLEPPWKALAVVFMYMSSKELSLGLSSCRPGKVTTNLPGRPAPKTSRENSSLRLV